MIQKTPTNTAADIREEWAAGGDWTARIEATTGHQWGCLTASIRREHEQRADIAHAVGINHVIDGRTECTCSPDRWKHDVATAAKALQAAIDKVPSSVGHYAIEQSRPLLRVLAALDD